MTWRFWLVGISLFWLGLLSFQYADAATHTSGELSVMGMYSKTTYGDNAYSTSRRYTGTFGVNIFVLTEIELAYTYADSFSSQQPYQTMTTNEQTLSLSWVQTIVPASWHVQPYLKAGAAQYNRRQNGTQNGAPLPEAISKSPSAVLGGGIRVFLFHGFSIKAEAVGYLTGFHMSQYKNNFAVQGGLGWHF